MDLKKKICKLLSCVLYALQLKCALLRRHKITTNGKWRMLNIREIVW